MTAYDHTNHHHRNRRATRPSQAARSGRRGAQPPSSLQVLESTFRLVTTGPDPLMAEGAAIGHGLPHRRIGLGELRAILAHPATSRWCRDAIWRHLVHNARTRGPSWLVAAAGVALPELEAMAAGLTNSRGGDTAELSSAVLAGFVEALRTIEITRPGLGWRLCWMAYRTALKSRHHRPGSLPPTDTPPRLCLADPEMVVKAIATGTISPLQAELITGIRIDNLPLTDLADHLGITTADARTALQHGEAALAAAINNDDNTSHCRSGAADSSGRADTAGPVGEPGSVRGHSTTSDGTSETTRSTDGKGVFCGPAHHPTIIPSKATGPARREHGGGPRRRRCSRARGGGSWDRPGGGSS